MQKFDYPRMILEFTEHDQIFLSQREVQCLCFTLEGLSCSDISAQLQLREKTIDFYLRNIRKKIQAYELEPTTSGASIRR